MGRLVLSRYEGEALDVILPSGERIEVMPVRIGLGKVRLSIDAPGTVRVLRREVTERIEQERVQEADDQQAQAQESEGEDGERECD